MEQQFRESLGLLQARSTPDEMKRSQRVDIAQTIMVLPVEVEVLHEENAGAKTPFGN